MKKDEFILMLQEKEIREEIKCIVKEEYNNNFTSMPEKVGAEDFKTDNESVVSKQSETIDCSQNVVVSKVEENRMSEDKISQLKEENIEMHKKLRQVQEEYASVQNYIHRIEIELNNSKNKTTKLNEDLEKAQQLMGNMQLECDKWKDKFQIEKRNTDNISMKLKKEVDVLKREKQQLEQYNNSLEDTNKSMKTQMEQRFQKGWELFEAYQNVDEHTKQLLHYGVFTQETNFMSFICGGAQTDSLEKLWDVLKECIMFGNEKDSQILWDIFEYCIELVNSSKTQAKYEIMPVTEGDKYDCDIHMEGPNSLAQGKVINVYLPGYKNTYNNKILRKSIVQVG